MPTDGAERAGPKGRRTSGSHRPPTISTVAEAAGVSTATVSRVLAGSGVVTADLTSRVLKAVEELSYQPSGAARGLALGSLRNLGVVLPDLSNAYFFDIVKQMHHAAVSNGYRMLIADHSGQATDELATVTDLLGQVDGLVLLSSRMPTAGLKALARQPTPVVLVNRVELGVDLPMVAVDSFTAMMQLCGRLRELGHRRVVYVSGSDLAWQSRERWRGVEMAKVIGIEPRSIACDGTIDGGYAAVEEALSHEPTALICFNDLSALGVISKLRDLGLRVPEDLSVTGFDDIEMARHIAPRLTTVISPKTRLGELAWEAMAAALVGNSIAPQPLLPADIVIRDSIGPAAR